MVKRLENMRQSSLRAMHLNAQIAVISGFLRRQISHLSAGMRHVSASVHGESLKIRLQRRRSSSLIPTWITLERRQEERVHTSFSIKSKPQPKTIMSSLQATLTLIRRMKSIKSFQIRASYATVMPMPSNEWRPQEHGTTTCKTIGIWLVSTISLSQMTLTSSTMASLQTAIGLEKHAEISLITTPLW